MFGVKNCYKPREPDFLGKLYWGLFGQKGLKWPERGVYIKFFDKNCHLIFLKIMENEPCSYLCSSSPGKVLVLELLPKILFPMGQKTSARYLITVLSR